MAGKSQDREPSPRPPPGPVGGHRLVSTPIVADNSINQPHKSRGNSVVTITVDSPTRSWEGKPVEAKEKTICDKAGDEGVPFYGATSESTPLKPKRNAHLDTEVNVINLRNSMASGVNGSNSSSHQSIPGGTQDGVVIGNNGSPIITTGGAAEGSEVGTPRYGVGSLGLPIGANRFKLPDEMFSRDADSICTQHSDFNRSDKYDSKRSCWWRHPKVRENWRVFFAAFGLLIIGTGLIVMGVVVTVIPEIGFQSYVFFIAGAICFIPGAYHVVYVYCAVKGRKGYDFYQLPLFN